MPRGPYAAGTSVRKKMKIRHLHPSHKECIYQLSHCLILPLKGVPEFPSTYPSREQGMD